MSSATLVRNHTHAHDGLTPPIASSKALSVQPTAASRNNATCRSIVTRNTDHHGVWFTVPRPWSPAEYSEQNQANIRPAHQPVHMHEQMKRWMNEQPKDGMYHTIEAIKFTGRGGNGKTIDTDQASEKHDADSGSASAGYGGRYGSVKDP